jgi:hypothetical protein
MPACQVSNIQERLVVSAGHSLTATNNINSKRDTTTVLLFKVLRLLGCCRQRASVLLLLPAAIA